MNTVCSGFVSDVMCKCVPFFSYLSFKCEIITLRLLFAFRAFYLLSECMNSVLVSSCSFRPYLSLSFNRLKNLFISTWFHSLAYNTYSYSNEIPSTSQLLSFVVATRPHRTFFKPFYYSTTFFSSSLSHLCLLRFFKYFSEMRYMVYSIPKNISYVRKWIFIQAFFLLNWYWLPSLCSAGVRFVM